MSGCFFLKHGVEKRQVTEDPQTKPTDWSCGSVYRLLSSTLTIAIYYYSARKLVL